MIILIATILIAFFATRHEAPPAPTTYTTKEECEATTQKECYLLLCDNIPDGKTFEEVCGRGFKEGWAPKLK